jgi:hypothetical protein
MSVTKPRLATLAARLPRESDVQTENVSSCLVSERRYLYGCDCTSFHLAYPVYSSLNGASLIV